MPRNLRNLLKGAVKMKGGGDSSEKSGDKSSGGDKSGGGRRSGHFLCNGGLSYPICRLLGCSICKPIYHCDLIYKLNLESCL